MPRKVRVQFAGSRASKLGIFSFIVLFFKELELRERFEKVPFRLAKNAVFKVQDRCLLLLSKFVLGIERIYHLRPHLCTEGRVIQLLGLKRLPGKDVLYSFLRRIKPCAVRALKQIHHELYQEYGGQDPKGQKVLDIDMTTISTEARKRKGATPGKNTKAKGKNCYQWTVAFFWGQVVWEKLSSGATHCITVLREAFINARRITGKIDVLRLDGGYFSQQILAFLREQKVSFLIKIGMKIKWLKDRINAGTIPWKALNRTTFFCDAGVVRNLLPRLNSPLRVILVRNERWVKRRKKKRGRVRTIRKRKVIYYAIVTNIYSWSARKILKFYKKRWCIENFFKEANTSFNRGLLPSRSFHGNAAYLALLVLAFNVMRWFAWWFLPKSCQKLTLKTMRLRFIHQAVETWEEDGKLEIIFGEQYPYQREVVYIQRWLNHRLRLSQEQEAA